MRIAGLFLNKRPETGGHYRYLELLRGLAERGHRVVLLRRRGTALSVPMVEPIDVPVSDTGLSGMLPHSLRWKRAVASVAPALDPVDLVITFGETGFAAAHRVASATGAALLVGIRSLRLHELRTIAPSREGFGVRRLLLPAERLVARRRERRMARHATRLVFQTEHDRDEVLSRHPDAGRKCGVVPNSIGGPRFAPELRDTNRSTELARLLYVGQLIPRKDVSSLIAALELLRDDGHRLSLDIVGSGPEEQLLRNRVHRLGLDALVTFHGSRTDALRMIAETDLLVLPSLFDSFPNVLLEALHTGTAAIASDVGGNPEILQHQSLLFQPGNPRSLRDTLHRLVSNPEAFRRVRTLCRERARVFEFDWAEAFEAEARHASGHETE